MSFVVTSHGNPCRPPRKTKAALLPWDVVATVLKIWTCHLKGHALTYTTRHQFSYMHKQTIQIVIPGHQL